MDYYNARYYDPIVGRFVSADTVQGNEQGMDPYAYVMGNSETMNDPTGHWAWGLAATLLPLAAVVVGAVAFGALMVGAAPLLATIALGAAIGVVAAGAISHTSYADANGGWGSPFKTDQSLDDWGKRALLAEGIGGVVGGAAAWVGMASTPVAALFHLTDSTSTAALANGLGIITGGAGSIIGQAVSQTVFPSHPQQQSISKPSAHHPPSALRKPSSPIKKAPSYRNRSYSHYTAPARSWTSSYVNSSSWQQSVWNGWLATTTSYDPSSWITWQGEQNTHYVREIAQQRNGGGY